MAYIKHPRHIPFEYSKITEYIYLGTNQCCTVHFRQSLLKKGIKADISLEKSRLDAPFGVDYFLWLPVEDKTAPSQKQLILGANAIKDLIKNKQKVYIHCRRGHGRSPALVAAYFMLEGLSVNEAIKKIKKHRRIHLDICQIKALKRLKSSL